MWEKMIFKHPEHWQVFKNNFQVQNMRLLGFMVVLRMVLPMLKVVGIDPISLQSYLLDCRITHQFRNAQLQLKMERDTPIYLWIPLSHAAILGRDRGY